MRARSPFAGSRVMHVGDEVSQVWLADMLARLPDDPTRRIADLLP
jgi:hypothetical protein